MVNSCCAFGCTRRYSKNINIRFYSFPKDPVRKKLWVLALRRKNFEPSEFSRICNAHFQTGKPSQDLNHPDYVPSIFNFNPSTKSRKTKAKLIRAANVISKSSEKNMDASQEIKETNFTGKKNQDSVVNTELNKITETNIVKLQNETNFTGIKNQDFILNTEVNEITEANIVELQNETNFTGVENEDFILNTELSEITETNIAELQNVSEENVELLNLKQELHQAFTDISTLRKENDMLIKEVSAAEVTQNVLQKTASEKEKQIVILKMKLQQAYTEVSALRMEKEELQKKLLAASITQSILQDPNRLHFYTGLNSMKDFNYILSLLSGIENNVQKFSLETQLLIVLTKLKLNLFYVDLAYRFQSSPTTIIKICDIIIPVLETKLDALVKCPINTALKKNIPVCFKNMSYENLYQRLMKYSKSKKKQLEDEDGAYFNAL